MHISAWSSDVCSSDLAEQVRRLRVDDRRALGRGQPILVRCLPHRARASAAVDAGRDFGSQDDGRAVDGDGAGQRWDRGQQYRRGAIIILLVEGMNGAKIAA